jgi:hypothetical protein
MIDMREDLILRLNDNIEYLEELKKVLQESKPSNIVLDYYETSYVDTIADHIYKPRAVFDIPEPCEKCNGTGVIQVSSDKDIHYKMCDCFYSTRKYVVEPLAVRSIVDAETPYYMCFDGLDIICIPIQSVKNSFCVEDVYNEYYYKNKEDCEKACDCLNGGCINDK